MLVDWILVIFPLLWTSSHSCNPNEICSIDPDNENIKNLLASMDYFTTQLIQKLYDPDPDAQNMNPAIISPMSIYVILVLVLFGSAGNTQKELVQALHFPDADLQQLKKSFGDILIATESKRSEMVDGKEDVALEGHVPKGLFIQKDFTLVNEYAEYLSALNIKTEPVDFVNHLQDTMNTIVRWINDNNPRSNSMAVSFSSNWNLRIYLISMFYFTAKWKDNLFLDRDQGPVPFYNLKNEKIEIIMMKASTSLLYYDNNSSFSAVQIPYEGYDYAAVFILPHKGVDPVKFVRSFTMDILKEFLSKAEPKDIDCQIPTFSQSYSFELNKHLKELGITELFGEVDLSKMLNVEKQNLGVQMSHEIKIEVNKKGTTAEGLTVVPVKKNPPSTNLTPFIADHPFLMLIRSTNSYAIAFASFYYGG